MPIEFPFSANDIILGGLIPATVSAALCILSARILTGEHVRSFAMNLAVALAFFLGIRLVALTPWKPLNHWHWLPWIGIVSACFSLLTAHTRTLVRWPVSVILAGISAFLLIPDWDRLAQSRTWMISLFAGALIGVWLALRPLVLRMERRSLAIVLTGSAFGTAVILTLAGSLRLGQIGAAVASGFAGLVIAQLVDRKSVHLPDVSFLFTVLCCGVMFAGYLNSFSEVRLVSYLLPPLAPLTMWLGRVGPLAVLKGKSRVAVDICLPAITVLIAIAIAAATQSSADQKVADLVVARVQSLVLLPAE